MKLKDRPLEWWSGKRFIYWCRADRNDQRKIHYILHYYTITGPKEEVFTSEDSINPLTMSMIRGSVIKDLKLVDNEWYVELEN